MALFALKYPEGEVHREPGLKKGLEGTAAAYVTAGSSNILRGDSSILFFLDAGICLLYDPNLRSFVLYKKFFLVKRYIRLKISCGLLRMPNPAVIIINIQNSRKSMEGINPTIAHILPVRRLL